jgi:hypothetical protein
MNLELYGELLREAGAELLHVRHVVRVRRDAGIGQPLEAGQEHLPAGGGPLQTVLEHDRVLHEGLPEVVQVALRDHERQNLLVVLVHVLAEDLGVVVRQRGGVEVECRHGRLPALR